MADNTCGWYDVGCQYDWIVDEIKAVFVWASEQVFDGVLTLVDLIPVPSWAANIGAYSVPSEVMWFASAFEIQYGATVVASAFGLRFFIRRLPFIG